MENITIDVLWGMPVSCGGSFFAPVGCHPRSDSGRWYDAFGKFTSGFLCCIIHLQMYFMRRKMGVKRMPELSRFGGMVIYMLFYDVKQHNKPHVHVYYGEYEATIGIDGELLAGSIPRKQLKIITGWLAFHEEEVYRAWNLAVSGQHFEKIPPME